MTVFPLIKYKLPVDAVEEDDGFSPLFLEGLVEPLVSVVRGAPRRVFDAAMDVVLRVRLDYKVPGFYK